MNRAEPPPEVGSATWLNQSVNRLVRRGHSLRDIGEYTLTQFMMFLNAAEELEAVERLAFVADLAAVVGSLFSDGNPPIVEHSALLTETSVGVKRGNS